MAISHATIPDSELHNPKGFATAGSNAIMFTDSAGSLQWGKLSSAVVPNGEFSSSKFKTGTVERDWVLARTADASVGSIGTYAFLLQTTGESDPGDTVSGSNLRYAGAGTDDVRAASDNVPGTWRCMGYVIDDVISEQRSTVFLRVA